jgi:TonB-linked SusC/RagA family outer membrane protein
LRELACLLNYKFIKSCRNRQSTFNHFKNTMKKKLSTFLLATVSVLFVSFTAMAQNYTIKGKIADSNGQPMIGATVVLKGTAFGTAANVMGDYSFSAATKAGTYDLEFRSVGFTSVTKKITLGSANDLNVNIVMNEDGMSLDEVVVTGSTLKSTRRELGNSISTVSAQSIRDAGTNNLAGAIQGKIAGAQVTQNSGDPSGGITIRLRGIKSLAGSSDPLYVIDGVVVSNASDNVSQLAPSIGSANGSQNRLADINPNDIETLNVLNGAAAAAVYGSRAANGVVLITTKRGKSGTPKVTFSTSFSSNELRKKVFISTYGKQFGFAGLRLHTIGGVSAAQIAANPGTTVTGIVRDGATTNVATNLVDVTRYDYQDQIFQTGYGNDNNISISGGSDKTQYFGSVSYMKNQGIVKGTDFQRYGLRMRLDQRLTNWAKMSVGLAYSNSSSNEKPNGNVFYSPINSINITNNIWDANARDASGKLQAVEPTRINPLSVIEDMFFTQNVSRTISDVQFNLTPLPGLSVDLITGLDSYSQTGNNTINRYPYAAAAGLPAGLYPDGFAASASNQVMLLNTDLNITYQKQLTDKLKLTATGGFNYQFQRKEFISGGGENLSPFVTTPSGVSRSIVTNYGLDPFWVAGQFLQATVGYDNKLFVTAAIRRDGSSIFSASEINQYYPKLSASYVLKEDDNFTARLRGSFGDAGGVTALPTYGRFWQFSPNPYLGRTAFSPGTQLANERVRPERMREIEFGGDFGFLNNRIQLGISVFQQQITDLVLNRTIAPSSGGLSKTDNVGEMENKGLEITLGGALIKKKDFEIDANIIFSSNRNKITKLPGGAVFITNQFTAGDGVAFIEGQPASVFIGRIFARNADGSLLLTPQGLPQSERGTQVSGDLVNYTINPRVDGQPSGTNFIRTIVGNPNPDWTGSFSSNVRYKDLTFRFLLDAVQGVNVFNADKRTRNNVGIGDIAEAELRGTAPRGSVFALVPIEEYRVDDGSFVKLREIALGYRLPNLMKGMSNFNITLSGRNLISWDKYNGYDPETNAGGNSDRLRGTDFGNVPIPRTYQLSLTASF